MRTAVAVRFIGLFAAASLLVGCRSCASTVELADLPDELPEPICDKIFECCSQAEVAASQEVSFDDEAGCLTTYQASIAAIFAPALEEAVDAGRAEYDARAAAACLDEMPDSTCGTFTEQFQSGVICGDMITPLVGTGDMCKVNFECVQGTCVIDDFEAETGTCRMLPAEGEECLERARPEGVTDQLCSGDLVCVDGRCRERGGPGAECASSSQCRTACLASSNQCAPPGEIGDPCLGDEGCQSENCGADERCAEPIAGSCELL